MIPGIKGMGSFVIPTKSWYSMKRLKKTLRDMYQLTNGRIAYLLHNGETIFVLRKVKATIPCIDWEKGETKMRQQYLIDLDVVVDPLEVAREYSVEKVLQKGARAMTMLGAGTEHADAVSGTDIGSAEADSPSDEKDQPERRVEPELTRRRRKAWKAGRAASDRLATEGNLKGSQGQKPRRTGTEEKRWTGTRRRPLQRWRPGTRYRRRRSTGCLRA